MFAEAWHSQTEFGNERKYVLDSIRSISLNSQSIVKSLLSASLVLIWSSAFAEPITLSRINELPPEDQPAWKTYMEQSQANAKADQEVVQVEVTANGMTEALRAPSGGDYKLKPKIEDAWFGRDEAKQLA